MVYNNAMELATIGYEGLTPETFFALLIAHNIQTLIDVRELPISRKSGFSKSALRANTLSHNMAYVHMAALGCPRPIRTDYRADKDWKRYTRRFLEYLDTQQTAIVQLVERATHERCCLLCFEADYHFCHRSFVAERAVQVVNNGLQIIHLTNQAQAE
jgi:uncharacterized protein (DUF488 family)